TTGSDVLVLESDDFGSKQSVSITTLSGTFATTLGDGVTSAARDVGLDIGVQINGQAATGDGLKASVKTATLDASVSFKEANNAVNQSSTISITGGGATFQIGQEVSAAGQVGIGIEAVNTARLGGVTGKLYELGSGSGKSLVDLRNGVTGAGPRISAKDLTDIIDQALNRVTSLRGRLGSIQKNVIETNISTLGVALENITEARSQIVDTDFAEETAALQRNQVLSQAGISVLGIANQNPQQVLSLLR
ncbi:MAG: flagellin, partial [Planctomycetaceae bacterium]|nr:flagellin [Planctomycetaceae bacterium]